MIYLYRSSISWAYCAQIDVQKVRGEQWNTYVPYIYTNTYVTLSSFVQVAVHVDPYDTVI